MSSFEMLTFGYPCMFIIKLFAAKKQSKRRNIIMSI
jgi:hypothetical protein